MSLPIRGFIENSLLDWEGKIAALVFLSGCNFRCPYCHARHLLAPDDFDEAIPVEAVLWNLRQQRGWIDGVVISGGEPTLQPQLLDLIRTLRDEGVLVKLDTNGSRPDVLGKLLEYGVLDYVAMDVKAPLNGKYSEVAGVPVDLDEIRSSIELLISSDISYEFRTTVCPTQLAAEDIEHIGRAIRGAKRYYLQAFRPVNCLEPEMEQVKPYNPDEMRDLCRIAAKYVQRCMVRGDQGSELVVAAGRAVG